MTGYCDYLRNAAAECGSNLSHWLRYLRKCVDNGVPRIDEEDLAFLLSSDELTMVQKVFLERAMTEGTPTNEYVASLNRPAKTPMLNQALKELHAN